MALQDCQASRKINTAPIGRVLELTSYVFFCIPAWVIIGMIWTFCSAFTVVLYPLWESRVALVQIATGIVKVQRSSPVAILPIPLSFPF